MKIHLMTGLLQGGAAAGAKHLTNALAERGIDARLYFPSQFSGQVDPGRESLYLPAQWTSAWHRRVRAAIGYRIHRQTFKRKMRRRPPGFEIFSSPMGAPITPWPPSNGTHSHGDVLHLHWITKLIDYTSFFQSVPSEQPIVWTLHDMNPFTGGCHFSAGCRRFETGCGRCPQLAEQDGELSAEYFQTKVSLLAGKNLHVVAPSRWMIRQAMASPIFRNVRSFHHIPYGLPAEVHNGAIDRVVAREQLGLDPDAFVFSFGAADVDNQRKGARFLMKALELLSRKSDREMLGLVFGGGALPESPVPIRQMGFLKSVVDKMQVYCASDVFVVPSTEDNLPFTALEAMSGGAALLGFDVSGVPDLVLDGVTGRLAKAGDGEDLGEKLAQMARDTSATNAQGIQAKEIASRNYVSTREADDYQKLYAALLSSDESSETGKAVAELRTCVE